jgi:PKD repeat protein
VAAVVGSVAGAAVGSVAASTDDSLDDSGGVASVSTQETTTPTISSVTASNPTSRDVRVSFDSDEQLETIEASISGAGSATLTTADFSESSSDGTYTYTATYSANSDGDYTATLETAADSAGDDGASGQSETVTVDTRIPQISNYGVSNPTGQTVAVSFDSDERIASIEVLIGGAESATLTTANFTETSSGGTYTYTATYDGSTDGTYTAELETAADDAGNNGAFSQTESVTVDTTPPTISAFDVSNPSGQDVRIAFDTNEQLDNLRISIDGPESATLYRSDFFGVETDDGFSYAATYEGSSDGNYTVTIETATDTAGNDAGTGQNETVVVDTTPPAISNYSVSNPSERNVTVTFETDERLDDINISVDGPASGSILRSSLNQTVDGSTYTYTGTFTVSESGNYTATLVTAADSHGNDGASGQAGTATVTIPDRTSPTPVVGTNRTVAIGAQVTFDASNSTDNVGIERYEWDFDGDGSVDTTGQTTTRTFDEPGTYTVTLTVADAAGNEDTDSVTISVRDTTSPTAVTGPNRTVETGVDVTLDGRNSTDNVGIATYEWDFDGDGTAEATGQTATYIVDQPGTHTVTLTVVDAAGNTDTDTVVISATDPSTTVTTSPPTTDTTTPPMTTDPTETSPTSTEPTDDGASGSGDTGSGIGPGFTGLLALFGVLTAVLLGIRRQS